MAPGPEGITQKIWVPALRAKAHTQTRLLRRAGGGPSHPPTNPPIPLVALEPGHPGGAVYPPRGGQLDGAPYHHRADCVHKQSIRGPQARKSQSLPLPSRCVCVRLFACTHVNPCPLCCPLSLGVCLLYLCVCFGRNCRGLGTGMTVYHWSKETGIGWVRNNREGKLMLPTASDPLE